MLILSHFQPRLSIGLALAFVISASSIPAENVVASAGAKTSPYFGRWTVDEDRPVFTARGRQYKTIDVAPCGKDFCGVSVKDNGNCGPTLFRFLGKRIADDHLQGHGKWGDIKKNIVIYSYDDPDTPASEGFELYLGEGYNFGDRSDNVPKYYARYKRLSGTKCRVS